MSYILQKTWIWHVYLFLRVIKYWFSRCSASLLFDLAFCDYVKALKFCLLAWLLTQMIEASKPSWDPLPSYPSSRRQLYSGSEICLAGSSGTPRFPWNLHTPLWRTLCVFQEAFSKQQKEWVWKMCPSVWVTPTEWLVLLVNISAGTEGMGSLISIFTLPVSTVVP